MRKKVKGGIEKHYCDKCKKLLLNFNNKVKRTAGKWQY